MTENITARKFADKSALQTEKLGEAAEQTTKLIQNTFETASKGIRDYNLKTIEIGRVNSDAAFKYAQQLLNVKSPSEMLELWTTHARKQFETLTEQTKELAMLGQRVATETAEPLASGATKAFQKVA